MALSDGFLQIKSNYSTYYRTSDEVGKEVQCLRGICKGTDVIFGSSQQSGTVRSIFDNGKVLIKSEYSIYTRDISEVSGSLSSPRPPRVNPRPTPSRPTPAPTRPPRGNRDRLRDEARDRNRWR